MSVTSGCNGGLFLKEHVGSGDVAALATFLDTPMNHKSSSVI